MNVIQKIKDSTASKTVVTSAALLPVLAGSMITAFAADESSVGSDFSSTLQTSLSSMQSDIFGYIAIVLPIALGVVAAFFGIKKAISFFKSTAK